MSRDAISDEVWAVIGSLFPSVKATGRPPVDCRTVVEAMAWRFRTGAPWRDVPERFGSWNTIYKNFNRRADAGVWARVLERVQSLAQQSGDLDWVASIDSTIVRVHQHGATLPRGHGGSAEGIVKLLRSLDPRSSDLNNLTVPAGGEFDDAGGDLAVEQDECTGSPHPQVEVAVGQSSA